MNDGSERQENNNKQENNKQEKNKSEQKITKEFLKITNDFVSDLCKTFPDFKDKMHPGLFKMTEENINHEQVLEVYEHCKTIFPERFFDILYQNENIFNDDETNTMFLPYLNFSALWNEDISDNTKNVMWKYLQLLLFSIIGDTTDSKSFGNAAKLFEAINEDEFKNKLEETMKQMSETFSMDPDVDISNISAEDLPISLVFFSALSF